MTILTIKNDQIYKEDICRRGNPNNTGKSTICKLLSNKEIVKTLQFQKILYVKQLQLLARIWSNGMSVVKV